MLDSQNRRVFKVSLPMRVRTSSKKRTALNLNVYRNLHFRSLSAQKNTFHKLMQKLLKDIPSLGRVHLHYDVCPKSKTKLDLMNVGSIVDKYFSDSLVEFGVLEDDSYTFINFVSFGFGGLSTEEHVLVTITEIEQRKGSAMRVLLDQSEIQEALEAFVENMGLTNSNGVELTTSDDGEITAEILFGDTSTEPKKETKPKRRGGRPFGSKNRPKEDKKDAGEGTTPDGNSDSGTGASESAQDETEAPDKSEVKFSEPEPTSEEDVEPESETSESGNSKNLFGGSPEESSETKDPSEKEDEGHTDSESKPKTVIPKSRKPSIFDT